MSKVLSVVDASGDNVSFDEVKSWFNDHMHVDTIDFNDPKPYEVYEKGRWSGIFQCIDGKMMVSMKNGSKKYLRDVSRGDKVLSFDTNTGSYVSSIVDEHYDQGVKDCIELTFENGKTLICTSDHLIMTKNRGWVEAGTLTKEDDVECFSAQ